MLNKVGCLLKIFKGGYTLCKNIYTFNVMKYVFIFWVNRILDWKRIMTSCNNLLTLKNVNVYYGRKKAVKDASFSISPGEIVGLVGPNGSGKTTIMKALLGIAKSDGQILLNQQPITLKHHHELQRVGALIEYPAVYPFLTGRENLALYARDIKKMDELVERLQMTSYINRKAKGYSVGMRQKLGIALALLDDPEFVILDEPMNGLDIEATILIRQIISDYAKHGTAFLISSHVLSELQKIMTKVIILNKGCIVLNASIDQIMQQPKRYRVQTSCLNKTIQLLRENDVKVQPQDNYCLVAREDVEKVQKILMKQNIWLTALIPDGVSFENIVVNILKKKRAEIK